MKGCAEFVQPFFVDAERRRVLLIFDHLLLFINSDIFKFSCLSQFSERHSIGAKFFNKLLYIIHSSLFKIFQ